MPNDGEPMYAVHNSYTNTILVGDYSGHVIAFDGADFSEVGSVAAGNGVFHMWLSPNNQQLWVNNELDRTISVINPNTLENIATVALPQDLYDLGYKPHDVIVAPDNASAFVSLLGNHDEDYVIKYSTTTFEEIDRVAVGLDPHVSLTPNNDKLYVASQFSSELKVLNRSDLAEVATLNIPNAHGLGMNSAGTYLYVSNISNGGVEATYTVDLMTNTLVGDPVDAPFAVPHNYSVSSDDSKLYLTHSGPNSHVSVYDLNPLPTLSTSIAVENNPFGLVAYSYEETITELTICAGDGTSDAFDVMAHGANGGNIGWVITDADLNILAVPAAPPFDLEGAPAGVCLIWQIAYEDGLTGLEMGNNVADLMGCYDLSNAITVTRESNEGGVLEGGPFAFCVGDGVADHIEAGAITLSGNSGANSQWVVTFPDGSIAGLPPSYEVVDFDGAGDGVCSVWHLSYADGLTGLEPGLQLSDIEGCYSLSNPIEVSRTQPEGGVLEGGPFAFCVGDGEADNIEAGAITLSGNSGANSQWVVTFPDGSIAGLPPSYEVVDFDGAGEGVCSVWHLSYADGLTGLEPGLQLSEIEGCYSLSNPIEVSRTQPEGGVLEGGPFAFCVGDGVADHIEAGAITLSGNSGANSQWVVTFPDGSIAGLPPSYEVVDFDGAGEGVCSVWHLSYADGLTGLEPGMQLSEIQGCYSLSNPIEVDRTQPEGGVLEGGPFEFEVGDGVADMIPDGAITLSGNSGSNSQWVVTFEDGSIAGLPPSYDVVEFDGAGEGTCSVYHLSYEDGIVGLEQGAPLADLEGCFSLSNAISVVRSNTDGLIDNGTGTTFTSILDKALDVDLYPNPVADLLQVSLDVPSKEGDVDLQIISLAGKVLYSAKINADQSRVSIPVSTLFDGIYILTVVHDGEIVTKRFVKN
ncbi:MAG: T9SS C-terminal target domain-containing protein [Bacteroidetes bacterium]|nr:MAG: T9SS C-terminal target domain-containing protein [Bacteroidota bacterium]